MASELIASGVGASYYVPGKASPPSVYSPGECSPAADCHSCQRLGFACVDHATVAPCTAEGGCRPAAATYGWYKPNWRRWPGTADARSTPRSADPAEDSLLPQFEPPEPEEEDKQAPPPIDDNESDAEAGDSSFEGFDTATDSNDGDRTGIELNLPRRPESPVPSTPAPRVLPPRPSRPEFGNGPPSLPFGFVPPNPSAAPARQRAQPAAMPIEAVPVSLPAAKRSEGGPPPLPFGFTRRATAPATRRLPMPAGPRYDTAVLPTAAQMPISR